jgi:DNA-binding transcriptional ArsR family regulator
MTQTASPPPSVPGPGTEDRRIRILSPDDEETRRIGKAVSSSTAGDILRYIGEEERTASSIADGLSLPVSTVMYHLDSLEKAGLIEIVRMSYSVKGREVKIYRLTRQILIVTPEKTDIREQLLKYASLFVIPAGAFLIALAAGTFSLPTLFPSNDASFAMMKASLGGEGMAGSPGMPAEMMVGFSMDMEEKALPALAPEPVFSQEMISPDTGISIIPGIPDLALGVFIGGVIVIISLVILFLAGWYRSRTR